MPDGTITAVTPGLSAPDDGQDLIALEVARELLVSGVNVLAVEVHQAPGSSTDVNFYTELLAELSMHLKIARFLKQSSFFISL